MTTLTKESVERALRFADELRKWWRFDNEQQHTHSWHDREDFISQKLPAIIDQIRAEQRERDALIVESYGEDQIAAAIRAQED